jgi:hypothetical protein
VRILKEFSFPVNPLEATLLGVLVSVDCKGDTGEMKKREIEEGNLGQEGC